MIVLATFFRQNSVSDRMWIWKQLLAFFSLIFVTQAQNETCGGTIDTEVNPNGTINSPKSGLCACSSAIPIVVVFCDRKIKVPKT